MKVPKKDKDYVISLCKSICPDSKCVYVPVKPLPDKPANECFSIVPEHIISNGGEQKFGWSIWHWPHVFVEAEFHAVWKSPKGALIDITPKSDSFGRILFLPDPHRFYDGRQVDNIRKPISNDPLVKKFLDLWEERYREMNKGYLANQHGIIIVPQRVREIDYEVEQLSLILAAKFGFPF